MPSTATSGRLHSHGDSPDPVAVAATGVLGGPRGRYAAGADSRARRSVLAGVLGLGACLTVLVGFLQKAYCVREGWGAPAVYWKACYSDLPSVALRDAMSGVPYSFTGPFGEPLGTGLALRALSFAVPADGLARQQGFFVAWTLTAALLLLLTVAATVWTVRRRPEWAAHVAFSPLVVTVALVSADLVGVAATSVAVWAWARRRPALAGLLFGLATVTRTYPVLVLLAVGLVALRAGVVRVWARTAGVALLTAVAALAAGLVLLGPGVFAPYEAWTTATAQLGSPWYLGTLAGRPIPVGALTLLTVLGWLLAVGVGLLFALGTPVRPRLGEVAIVVVVVVLLTGKALPVQSSLWLVPLVAIAGLRWRDHLIWAAGEVLAFVAVWLYLGGLENPTAALPAPWYAVFLVVRLAALAWLAVAAVHQARARVDVADDDAAGAAQDRSDAVVVRFR